jgi:hypothetical protein
MGSVLKQTCDYFAVNPIHQVETMMQCLSLRVLNTMSEQRGVNITFRPIY